MSTSGTALQDSTESPERAPDDGPVRLRRPKLDFNGLTVGIDDRSISRRKLHLAARLGEPQLREESFDFTRLERRQRVGLGDLMLAAEFAFDFVDTKRRDLNVLAHAVWLGIAMFDQPVHDLITSLRIQTHGFAD